MNFHVCTVCDSNYLLKAVAMYNSILRQTRNNNIIMFWLCIDADTYRMVNDLKKTTKALIYSYYLPEIEILSFNVLLKSLSANSFSRVKCILYLQ